MDHGKVESESTTDYFLVLVGDDEEQLTKACHRESLHSIWLAPHLEENWMAYVIQGIKELRVGRLQTVLQEDYGLKIFQASSESEAKRIAKTMLQFEK